MKKLTLLTVLFLATANLFAQYSLITTDATCSGSCDGSIMVSPTGTYSVLWNTGDTGQVLTNLCAGVYVAELYNQSGTFATLTDTVFESQSMTVTTNVTQISGCGFCDGSITPTVIGGTPPYTYVWSHGTTTQVATYLCAGTYSATIVDAQGCTVSFSTAVTTASFSVDVIASTDMFCSDPGSATIHISGASQFTIVDWSDGSTSTGADSIQTHFYASPGTYTISVYDSVQCYAWDSVTINQTLPYTTSMTTTDQDCGILGNAKVEVVGATPPVNYEWNTNPPQFTDSIGGLLAGTYTVSITDGNAGCTVTETALIRSLNPLSSQRTTTPELCDYNNGTATVIPTSGTPPYTYEWNTTPPQFTATAIELSNGSYAYTFVDANLCSGSGTAYVGYTSPVQANPTVTNEVCGDSSGSVTLTPFLGTPPYVYQWSNGGSASSITGLTDGYYSFTLDDAQGCSVTGSRYVADVPPFNVSITFTPETCLQPGTATVNVTGNTGPYTYAWNTVPVQTGATATGLTSAYYRCTVTDANGCSDVKGVYVQYDPLIRANLSPSDALCLTASGSVNASVWGGLSPYTFLWSTGATTQNLFGVEAGYYNVTITDANGCQITKSVRVNSYSNLGLSITTDNATCIFTSDGQATANVTNGLPPITYHWSNGQNTQTATGLQPSWRYNVRVTDANGCTATRTCIPIGYDNLSCAVQISGKVLHDVDKDCDYTPGDEGLYRVPVQCIPGYYDLTGPAGDYGFIVPPGNYALNHTPPYHTFPLCPVGAVQLLGMLPGEDTTVNFYDTVRAALDLSVYYGYITPPRPGFQHQISLTYENKGNVTANAIVEYEYDADVQFISSNVSGYVHDVANRKVQFTFNNFSPGSWSRLKMWFLTPAGTSLGTLVKDCASIYPVINDVNFTNNVDCDSIEVVGSFDPNDKAVEPKGSKVPGQSGFFITQDDSVLHYKIRFQNTGTHWAEDVAILDTLDESLDPATISNIKSSHNVRADFFMNKYLAFYFDDIFLPDSNMNEKESHGFVNFQIKLRPDLPNGTEINNRAAIYFDYNEPIITNTVTLKLAVPTSIEHVQAEYNSALAIPNPTKNGVFFKLKDNQQTQIERVELFDLSGKHCLTVQSDQMDLNDLRSGMYFFRVHAFNGDVFTGKVVKE